MAPRNPARIIWNIFKREVHISLERRAGGCDELGWVARSRLDGGKGGAREVADVRSRRSDSIRSWFPVASETFSGMELSPHNASSCMQNLGVTLDIHSVVCGGDSDGS